jgi:3-hydroxyacyl-CoA dehydrogenase
VEVKIGVQHAPRELVLESALSPEEVEAAVATAFKSPDGVLTLEDEKGRRVVVPVTKLAYVEIAENNQRRVGFGAV